jgi:DNA invertase Pin-like site-specific DNA recombinase
VDIYHPVPSFTRARTIYYDRRPRWPGLVAIAIGIVTAALIVAMLWAQVASFGRHAAMLVPRARAGCTSVWARRKDVGQDEGPDPMTLGGADEELAVTAHQWWVETAMKAGIDLTGFDPQAPLAERIAWAIQAGLEIAAVLSRFSSKLQHSTRAQVQCNVEYAGHHKMYVPPEFICVDEAQKGRRVRRDGLNRAREILHSRQAQTLLVFKVSRLLRTGYKSFQFVNEEIVEEGLRAVSTSQGIDTRDEKTWKALMYLHGMMDEMLLDTIADHCRAGLKSLFEQGYTTGALTVGYGCVAVPGAPLTNRKLPRTMPKVILEVAKLIKQHYEWIRDGMTIKEAWRRWRAAGGPYDNRSTNKCMSYQAYRRLLSNPRYLGCWAFGCKRNRWSSKLDYNRQVDGPKEEVAIYRCEDLRIVDDELFFAVQARLAEFKLGPRGPHKQKKEVHLWDLVTEFFYCAPCKVRFWQAGAAGKGMQCKRGDDCPCKSAVNRQEAVEAICKKLVELIRRDADLLRQIICGGQEIDARGDEATQAEIASAKARIQALTNKIDDLEELSGQGSEEDRQRRKSRINAATVELAAARIELTRLENSLGGGGKAITPERITQILDDFAALLEDAASSKLGPDVVYKSASVFRRLVGGKIWVHVERRPGRQRTVVRAVFTPQLLRAVTLEAQAASPGETPPTETVEVWLREPPKLDALAERTHQLIDIDGLSYREAAKVLQAEGHKVNSGNVWYFYRRWYEMQGLPVPERPYNNGRPRKPH